MNTASIRSNTTRFAFNLVISLFFLWVFSNNLNPILIPHLKKSFTLTTTKSCLLIMSIVGGAILPGVFNVISDATGNIQLGYLVPLICFVIVAWFGWNGYKVKTVVEMEKEPAIVTTL